MRILGFALFSSLLLLSLTTRAQVSIGLKGGIDFSKMINAVEGNDGTGTISLLPSGTGTGFYGGIFADIPLDTISKMFYLRPGLQYVGAGGATNATGNYYNGNGFTPSTKYALQYIDLPVEFVYSPGFGWGRPWVGVGLYAGVLVSGTIKTQGGSSQSAMIGNKANDNFQPADFGYTLSFGLATKPGFLFGIDYQHGFSRIVPNSSQQTGQPRLQTRNSIWGMYLGWIFKL